MRALDSAIRILMRTTGQNSVVASKMVFQRGVLILRGKTLQLRDADVGLTIVGHAREELWITSRYLRNSLYTIRPM